MISIPSAYSPPINQRFPATDQDTSGIAAVGKLHPTENNDRPPDTVTLSGQGRQLSAGRVSYSYQTGPDGVKYAKGGEVPIDIFSERTPEATIQKMETVRRATLAPADPSPAASSPLSPGNSRQMMIQIYQAMVSIA